MYGPPPPPQSKKTHVQVRTKKSVSLTNILRLVCGATSVPSRFTLVGESAISSIRSPVDSSSTSPLPDIFEKTFENSHVRFRGVTRIPYPTKRRFTFSNSNTLFCNRCLIMDNVSTIWNFFYKCLDPCPYRLLCFARAPHDFVRSDPN